MTDFLVAWEIDITADTPEEAAMQALLIQRRPGTATVFSVIGDFGVATQVDLTELAQRESGKIAAAMARLNGEFDHPELVKFGALSTDAKADVLAILRGE